MNLEHRISTLEAAVSNIKADYVTRDKLEAEIAKAKLEGVKIGATIVGLLFAGLLLLAAVMALI